MATHASTKQYRPVHQFSGRVNKPRPTKVATKIFPSNAHFPRDAHLPRDANLSGQRHKRFRRAEANLYGQVNAKPYAHAHLTGHLTGHLARACTCTCLQAEESPQLDEQKGINSKGIPKTSRNVDFDNPFIRA